MQEPEYVWVRWTKLKHLLASIGTGCKSSSKIGPQYPCLRAITRAGCRPGRGTMGTCFPGYSSCWCAQKPGLGEGAGWTRQQHPPTFVSWIWGWDRLSQPILPLVVPESWTGCEPGQARLHHHLVCVTDGLRVELLRQLYPPICILATVPEGTKPILH